LELRIAHTPAKLVRQHRHLASRIDNDFRKELLARAVRHLHFDTNCLIAFKQHLFHKDALVHSNALFSSVIDQQMIKLRARDLPRDSALVMHRFEEVERPRFLTRGIRKLHTVLSNKRTFLHFFEYAEPSKRPVSVSHQRFADVMTRKDLFFEKNYLAPFARENAGNSAPCGSTTHYDDVEIIIGIHA